MTVLINELKTRARLWLTLLQSDNANARKHAQVLCRQHRWDIPESWQLRHCLNLAAADVGFSHWEHARYVLSGQARAGDDMGDFWHGPEVAGLSNLWYATYADAEMQLQADPHLYLLPYRRQFLLVSTHYLEALKLNPDAGLWHSLQRDLVLTYASPAWQALVLQRLQASRIERFHRQWSVRQATLDLQSSPSEQQQVLKSFIRAGKLVNIPVQKKKRMVILHWLCDQLSADKKYPEADLNNFFLQFHEDYATLRREMIMNGLMQRADGQYWRLPLLA